MKINNIELTDEQVKEVHEYYLKNEGKEGVPFIKSKEIAEQIIKDYDKELRVVFGY